MVNRMVAAACVAASVACANYRKALPAVTSPRPAAPAVASRFSERARLLKLTRLVSGVPAGYEYGEFATSACLQKRALTNTEGPFEMPVWRYVDLFTGIMKEYGYPVDSEIEMFEGTKERVADVQVAARLTEMTMNVCYPRVNDFATATGSAYVKVEWSLYVPIERKVVLVLTTEGSTYEDVRSFSGEAGLFRLAFEDAIRRLAESAAYHLVIDPPKAAASQ